MSDQPTDDELDDTLEEGDPNDPNHLRRAANNAKRVRAERDTIRAERDDAKRELAVWKSGLQGLSDSKAKAILASIEGDVTPEAVKAKAIEFGWAEADANPDDSLADEIEQQERISGAAQGAGRAAAASVLKPEDVNDWPIDKQMRLLDKHPAVYEQLMRGETVAGFAFA